MSGGLPDVRRANGAHDGRCTNRPHKEKYVPLIQVKVIKGVFTAPQMQEIVKRLTDAMVEVEGESMRRLICCVVEEVASGEWGIGGQVLTADDVKALARGGATP
jgi:4-oxalocrotonate tautomerase